MSHLVYDSGTGHLMFTGDGHLANECGAECPDDCDDCTEDTETTSGLGSDDWDDYSALNGTRALYVDAPPAFCRWSRYIVVDSRGHHLIVQCHDNEWKAWLYLFSGHTGYGYTFEGYIPATPCPSGTYNLDYVGGGSSGDPGWTVVVVVS